MFDGIYSPVGSSDDFIEDCERGLKRIVNFSITQIDVKVANALPVKRLIQPESPLL